MISMSDKAVPVSEVKSGCVRMLSASGMRLISRLTGMGIIKGTPMEVLRNDGRGPIVVGVKASRIALGRGMAQKVLVEPQADPNICKTSDKNNRNCA